VFVLLNSMHFWLCRYIGIHAREWISSATVIYIAYTLLSKYNQDPTITQLVDQFDYYILPVFNVDGYVYTWTTGNNELRRRIYVSFHRLKIVCGARLEAKHQLRTVMVLIRIVIGIITGAKVSLYSSLFTIHTWIVIGGASHDPCTDTYCGEKPFSEIEVAQVAKFIADQQGSIVNYINFHSYSQLWMSPWGQFQIRSAIWFSNFFLQRLHNQSTGTIQVTRWWIYSSCQCT
jgi:murein tripeptide amidase MpaA